MNLSKKILGKTKSLLGNSDYTVYVNAINGIELIPQESANNILIGSVFDIAHRFEGSNSGLNSWGESLDFGKNEYIDKSFSFYIGPGLPRCATPLGINISGFRIDLYNGFNQSFFGPRNELWNQLLPTSVNFYWQPTKYFELLSELNYRKITLEFPARITKDSLCIYGVIPEYGALRYFLREKKVI